MVGLGKKGVPSWLISWEALEDLHRSYSWKEWQNSRTKLTKLKSPQHRACESKRREQTSASEPHPPGSLRVRRPEDRRSSPIEPPHPSTRSRIVNSVLAARTAPSRETSQTRPPGEGRVRLKREEECEPTARYVPRKLCALLTSSRIFCEGA